MSNEPRREDGTQLIWRQLHWPRPLDPDRVTGLLRQWAADQRSPRLVLEVRSTTEGITHLIGVPADVSQPVSRTIRELIPGALLTEPTVERVPVNVAARFKASTRHRPLRSADPVAVVRANRAALMQVRDGEQAVVQILLGPGRIPPAVPTRSPSSIVMPWWQVAWMGNGGTVDSEKRTALREKVSDHGFACGIRLGVVSDNPKRRRALLLGLLAATRTSEAAGIQLHLADERPRRLDAASKPCRWPLRLNVAELAALSCWPVGDSDLPGQVPAHPKLLPPAAGTTGKGRTVARTTAPGVDALLRVSADSARHHVHLVGPTGVGKSVMLGRLIEDDIRAGRAVVVVEPKGDLVDDVLARIPAKRRDDVVVLDASDDQPVGLNPLATAGRRPEVVADTVLSVFRHLYGDAIGPRSGDILYAATLTLARRSEASLVMLPPLLTNPGFRRTVTAGIDDPIALGPFWAAYNAWSDAERTQAIAPLMNKLRPFLFRPGVRAVVGQQRPRFSLRQVFTERKILLVPLREGVLGSEAAGLLGSLVVAELWAATQERATIPAAKRHPVMVYIDEVQNYLHLPTDLGDALAQARGYGVGFHLAHQYLAQLSPAMQIWRRATIRALGDTAVRGALGPSCECLAAREPGLVLDPFFGAGTTAVAAEQLGRDWLGIELNPDSSPCPRPHHDSPGQASRPAGSGVSRLVGVMRPIPVTHTPWIRSPAPAPRR